MIGSKRLQSYEGYKPLPKTPLVHISNLIYPTQVRDIWVTLYLQSNPNPNYRELWDELKVKWPRSYWDDWIRNPGQRRERACLRPEISRTKTFGKVGVSNGLFFDKHLKHIVLR